MRVIKDNRRLPKGQLQILATAGWVGLLYLCWVVGMDSWERSNFSVGAILGAIPELDPFNERYRTRPVLTLFHTVPGLIWVIIGPLQFMGPVRRKVPTLHRLSGMIFLVIGISAGVSAFLMSLRFPMWGAGQNTIIGLVTSAFMVFAFVNALRHARGRRFSLHREWMIRGFATGMAVALFRVLLNDLLPAAGMDDFDTRWNTVTAVSFPILLGVAELWIHATRPKGSARVPQETPETAPTPA